MARQCIAVPALVFVTASLVAQEEEPLETRVHDVSWLTAEPRHAPFVVKPYGALFISRQREEVDAIPGESRLGDDEAEESQDAESSGLEIAHAAPHATAPAVIEALRELLERAAASGNHEPAILRVDGDRLQVTAAAPLHAVAAALLETLERAIAARVTVDCLALPLAALERHAPRWRETGAVLPGELFTACLGEAQARLLTASGRPGQRLASAPRRAQLFHAASQINQTGVIPVTNPIILAPLSGERLEARALPHPADGSIRVDLALGRFLWNPRSLDMGPDLGVYEPPAGTQEVLSTTVVVPQGKAIVAASLESPGLAVLVRAEMQPPGRPAPRSLPDGESVRLYDLAALLESRARRWPSPQPPSGHRGLEFIDAPDALSLLGLNPGEADEGFLNLARLGSSVVLVADSERHTQVRQALLASLERSWTSLQVEVSLWKLPRAVHIALRQAAPSGGVLAVDWEKGLLGKQGVERRRFSATGVAGAGLGVFAAATRSYLVDVHQVSGGTGFAILEASQPELQTCGTGVDLRFRAHLRGTDRARLRLDGGSATVSSEREVEAKIPTTLFLTASSRQAGEARPTGSAQTNSPVASFKKVNLTLPVQEGHRWSADIDLPLGRDVILDNDIAEDGTATVVIGRVRRAEQAN